MSKHERIVWKLRKNHIIFYIYNNKEKIRWNSSNKILCGWTKVISSAGKSAYRKSSLFGLNVKVRKENCCMKKIIMLFAAWLPLEILLMCYFSDAYFISFVLENGIFLQFVLVPPVCCERIMKFANNDNLFVHICDEPDWFKWIVFNKFIFREYEN